MRFLSIFVCCALGAISGGAQADLAHGTPHFTCTAPTQQIDSFGNLTPIPATGTNALKEFRFYIDAAATPIHVSAAPGCDYQSISGEVSVGSHSVTATAVNNALQESARSNAVNFTVPAPVIIGPNAPAGLTVQ
jgi:hypothetical protein